MRLRSSVLPEVAVLLAVLLLAPVVYAQEEHVVCGVAQGYPPYQFVDGNGEPTGIDVDIIRLVFEKMGRELTIKHDDWDNIVAGLRHEKIDCVAGMEINDRRRMFFDFTSPCYRRKGMVFVPIDSFIHTMHDLQWQLVAGDRDSFVEAHLKELGLYRHIRLYQTKSKDQSMQLLKRGKVFAVIAPRAVGGYLARKYKMAVRMIDVGDPGTPVGIAVAKGNKILLRQMETALYKLIEEGALEEVLGRWNIR